MKLEAYYRVKGEDLQNLLKTYSEVRSKLATDPWIDITPYSQEYSKAWNKVYEQEIE